MSEAPAEQLLRSSAVMAAGTIVSRLTGFARSAVLVYVLANSVLGDAFTVANTVPTILYILLAGGVLNSVLVPQVVRAMKREPDGGIAYAQRLMTLTALVLAVITVAATLAAPLIIDIYTTRIPGADNLSAVVAMAYWCLPQIFFYGVFTVTGQVLNARGSFGPMMWAPILNNIVAIGFTLAFAAASAATIDLDHPSSLTGGQIALLCGGATLGILVQAVVLLPVLRASGVPLRPRTDFRGAGLGKVGAAGLWTVLFVAANQLAYLVVTRVSFGAGQEALASGVGYGAGTMAYANAYLVFVLPHSIITVSVVTALLPGLSSLAADNRLDVMASRLAATIRTIGVILLPMSVVLVVLGAGVMTLLFGYGRMTSADAAYAGLVLAAFGLGLVPFSSHYAVLRGFYALEDTRTPFLLQCVIAVATVVSALVAQAFVPAGWRTAALALGWSMSYTLGYIVSASVLARRVGGLQAHGTLATYARAAVAAGVSAVAGLVVVMVVGAVVDNAGGGPFAERTLGLLLGAPVVLAGYLRLSRTLGIAEVNRAVDEVRARAGRLLRQTRRG